MGRFLAFAFVALSTVIALAACGGTDPMETPPTFTNVQTRVFNLSCNISRSCHVGSSAAGVLNLEDPAYARLMRPAVADPTKMLVVPGDPDHSYIMDKLLNRNVGNLYMPPTGMIEMERIDLVKRWIAAGAPND